MAEPYIGEIRMFAGNFPPRGWALCDGQLLAVSQHDALFSLLGTIYGGDGRTTFALPEMRGRIPVHYGNGPGLSNRPIGQRTGSENVALTANETPSHSHSLQATNTEANTQEAKANYFAKAADATYRAKETFGITTLGKGTTATGGGQSHTNMMPSLCINFIIALTGVYPSRT